MRVGLQIPSFTWPGGAAGIQHAIFNTPNVQEITPLEVFGREIIPAVAGL
jgi:hypothetical protein